MSKYVKFCPVCNETKQNMEWCDDEKTIEFSKGYWNVCTPKEGLTICPACNQGVLCDSILTHDEFDLIEDISDQDRNFLQAMIELKEKDPIEYQLKISQFRSQIQQSKPQQSSSSSEPANQRKCKYCGGTSFTPVKRKWSLMTGFMTNKTDLVCNNCNKKVQWIDL